jgi:hypothetical protein
MRAFGVVGWLLVAASAPAATWDATRQAVIEPLNSELHRHLPTFLKGRDLAGVLHLYATETGSGLTWNGKREVYRGREETTLRWDGDPGAEPIRARYERLLEHVPAIERAELRIDRVAWRTPAPEGYPATARLIVRGTCADGSRCQLEQHLVWRIQQRDGHWVITAEEVTARTLVTRRTPAFQTVTEPAGMQNVHTNASSPPFRLFGGDDSPIRTPSGSAVADVDRDGCDDVFLAGSPHAALYRNRCDGTFADVTVERGLPRPYDPAASGAVFFDYDNDGWPDLFVAAVAGGNRLFHNVHGRFEDVTAAAGIPEGPWSGSIAIADYDRDGFLDAYVARMGDHEKSAPHPNYSARNGMPNLLLRNRGDGTFVEVAESAGVASRGWDLAAAWGDYDGDGWPDLYVANEFGDNAFYRNRGDGTFVERAREAGVTDGGAGMGLTWGDYDADGDLDLYVSNMHANSGWSLFHPDFPTPIPWPYQLLGHFTDEVQRRSDAFIDRLSRGSTLFRNDGDGTFTDVSDAAGVRDAQWGWAAEFFDYDDDGTLDLYAVNGFLTGPIPDDL